MGRDGSQEAGGLSVFNFTRRKSDPTPIIQAHAEASKAYQAARKAHRPSENAYRAAQDALHQRLRVGA